MKHTKGPWEIYRHPHKDAETHDCIDPIGILIDTPIIEKNAQLIAAAPDLLLAANLVQNAYRNPKLSDPSSPFKDLTMINQMAALDMLDKAIAKAKGES